MKAAGIQVFLDQNPIEPLTVVTADGGKTEVSARSLARVRPTGRSMHVGCPKFSGEKLDEDDEHHFIDVRSISNVIKPARRLPMRRQKKN